MLKLETNGIIVTDDIHLFHERERNGSVKIPKVTYRQNDGRYMMTIPARQSLTGIRKTVYGATEEEVIYHFLIETQYKEKSSVPTLEDFTETVLKTHVWDVKEDTTYDKYEGIWRNHIRGSRIGVKVLNQITVEELMTFFKEKIKNGYSDSTLRTMHTVLEKTFLSAEQNEYVKRNPMKYVEVPYQKCQRPQKKKESYTEEEIWKLEAEINRAWKEKQQYPYSLAILIMICTGLRIGEMLALTWADIDWERKIININKQVVETYERDSQGSRGGKIKVLKAPKTDSSEREVPLPPPAVEWLRELRKRYLQLGLTSINVVCNRNGNTPKKERMSIVLRELCDRAGVEYASLHKLRKTYATTSINLGVDIATVSAALGHKNPAVTMKFYYKPEEKGKETLRNVWNDIYSCRLG